MDFKYKEYNCMLDKNEEGFIGYVKDIIDLYKQYAKDLLDDLGYNEFDNVREVKELQENESRFFWEMFNLKNDLKY